MGLQCRRRIQSSHGSQPAIGAATNTSGLARDSTGEICFRPPVRRQAIAHNSPHTAASPCRWQSFAARVAGLFVGVIFLALRLHSAATRSCHGLRRHDSGAACKAFLTHVVQIDGQSHGVPPAGYSWRPWSRTFGGPVPASMRDHPISVINCSVHAPRRY